MVTYCTAFEQDRVGRKLRIRFDHSDGGAIGSESRTDSLGSRQVLYILVRGDSMGSPANRVGEAERALGRREQKQEGEAL